MSARLQLVPICRKELLFYLRALLQTRPAWSSEDHSYGTAPALGLLRHVREAEYAMQEAVATCNRPSQLRFPHLLPDLSFSTMELWTHFEQDLFTDYRLHHHAMRATDLALHGIERFLAAYCYPLPLWPARCWITLEVDIDLDNFHIALLFVRLSSDLFSRRRKTGIAFLYCIYQRRDNQEVDDLLASLLGQLALWQPTIPESIRELYDKHLKGQKPRPSQDEIC